MPKTTPLGSFFVSGAGSDADAGADAGFSRMESPPPFPSPAPSPDEAGAEEEDKDELRDLGSEVKKRSIFVGFFFPSFSFPPDFGQGGGIRRGLNEGERNAQTRDI